MGDGCVDVPKIPSMQSLYIVWPGRNHQDCICPLCDDGNCVLKNCDCYSTPAPKLRSTKFNTTTRYSFCWSQSDLPAVKHASKIQLYFFYETKNCANNDSKLVTPFLVRKYSSYIIITDGKHTMSCNNNYYYYTSV